MSLLFSLDCVFLFAVQGVFQLESTGIGLVRVFGSVTGSSKPSVLPEQNTIVKSHNIF